MRQLPRALRPQYREQTDGKNVPGRDATRRKNETAQRSRTYDPCAVVARLSAGWIRAKTKISYGRAGITPGLNRSDKSAALAASPKNGDLPPVAFTWKISCMVRKSEEWE